MNGALTKADIVEAIYEKTEKNRTDVKNTVETLLLLMKQAIKKDHALLVSGFGSLKRTASRPARGATPRRTNPSPCLRERLWFFVFPASSGRNSTARKIWRNRYDACLFCHS